jgi:hypothetical protein
MVVAFAGNLVASPRDFGDQLGHRIGDPAQHEKGSPDSEFIEEIEGPPGVSLHPRLKPIPFPALDQAIE